MVGVLCFYKSFILVYINILCGCKWKGVCQTHTAKLLSIQRSVSTDCELRHLSMGTCLLFTEFSEYQCVIDKKRACMDPELQGEQHYRVRSANWKEEVGNQKRYKEGVLSIFLQNIRAELKAKDQAAGGYSLMSHLIL